MTSLEKDIAAFKKQYPACDSGDLQTFVIAHQSRDMEVADLEKLVQYERRVAFKTSVENASLLTAREQAKRLTSVLKEAYNELREISNRGVNYIPTQGKAQKMVRLADKIEKIITGK